MIPYPKLPASQFKWELYCTKVGFNGTEIFLDAWAGFKLKPEVTILGYCDAKDLLVRQRSEGHAIMVEYEGEKFWLHHSGDL